VKNLCKPLMRQALVLRAANILVTAVACFALYWSMRFGVADWLSLSSTEAQVMRATQLAPGNAGAWLHLADLRALGEGDALGPLRRALAASPQNSMIWIRLGLELEGSGRYQEAERCLLRAAALDRDFIPVWTLTNYYFRRADAARFFTAARRTLSFGRGDPDPVFRLCWSITDDGGQILHEAIPDRAETLAAYMAWLVRRNQTDDGAPVAQLLLQRFPQQGRAALLEYCDRLIAMRRIDAAMALWNDMNRRGAVEAGVAAPGRIVNGEFRSPPMNGGFDWRIGSASGVEADWSDGGLNLAFSGSQPDHCDLVSQLAPLAPGRTWRLRYTFQSSGLEAGAGLHWNAADAASGERFAPPLSQFTLTPRDFTSSPSGGEFDFVIPPTAADSPRLTRLALVYDRQPGSAPMQGWVRLQRVSVEEAK
jgi:tetratricopeptide (TPR) repeat protein